MAACSAACNEPGIRVASIPLRSNASGVIVYITAVVSTGCVRHVQLDEVDDLPGKRAGADSPPPGGSPLTGTRPRVTGP